MSIKALQEYTRISKYARYLPEQQRRESWEEQITRVMDMHREKFSNFLPQLEEDINFVEGMILSKRVTIWWRTNFSEKCAFVQLYRQLY